VIVRERPRKPLRDAPELEDDGGLVHRGAILGGEAVPHPLERTL
jgi:hypothetical protein